MSAAELAWLIRLTADDLALRLQNQALAAHEVMVPNFYALNRASGLPQSWTDLTTEDLLIQIDHLIGQQPDVRLYFRNLCEILKRRIKFQRILAAQPKPTMDQVGPRSLLEYGLMPTKLLGTWLLWRKWLFDIDNRSGQETGYLFEPVLASCMGGTTIGHRNSPVKRLDGAGQPTLEGRQIDCLDEGAQIAYEFKLRVSIAASGQGRFAEELSFPVECRAAALKPVLIVLDPTPSSRLAVLAKAFLDQGGDVYIEDAWQFIEQKAGRCMSTFIEKYLRPVLLEMSAFDDVPSEPLLLTWTDQEIGLEAAGDVFRIDRQGQDHL